MRPHARLASLCASIALTAPALARAEDVAPPAPVESAPPVTAATAPVEAKSWDAKYEAARKKLEDGLFEAAAQELDALAAEAPDDARHALAAEDASLARTWFRKGLTLVRRADLGDESVAARAGDRRTTDEIAVLYTNAVFFGLGTGIWVDVLAEPKDAAGAILPALAFAGGSAGLVAALDSGRGLRYGVPQSITTGMYLGLEEGLVWTLYNQASSRWDQEWSGKTVATVLWGSATVGAIAGGVLGQTFGTSPGRASFVGSTSLWTSALLGLAVSTFVDHDAGTWDDHVLLSMGVGLNAGALLGVLTAKDVSPSVARMRFVDLGGIAGGLLGGGLAIAANNGVKSGQEGTFSAVTGLGIASGLALAWYFTRDMPQDRPEQHATVAFDLRPTFQPTRGGATLGVAAIF